MLIDPCRSQMKHAKFQQCGEHIFMVISWTLQHSIPSRAQFIPKKLNSGGQPSNHKICLIKLNKNRAQNDYEIAKLTQKNLKLPRHASISSVVFNESSLLEIFYCVCVGQRENLLGGKVGTPMACKQDSFVNKAHFQYQDQT